MAFPLYLAMTAAEIQQNMPLPSPIAYMACHFSSYGTGLSNLPACLPKGSLLILNDRTPIRGHDPRRIAAELAALAEQYQASGILLDFQRTECQATAALAAFLVANLPCPVGISEAYAGDLPCAVFLPPAPLDMPLAEHLHPWQHRKIWLEAALDGLEITLTPSGAVATPLPHPDIDCGFEDRRLHCHYRIETGEDHARFTLFRTAQDLEALLAEAKCLGVSHSVGLWQELAAQ